jgi:hypothetical protein
MIMKFTEFEDELKESMKNNSTNSKRKQIKKKKTQEDTETPKCTQRGFQQTPK